MSIGSPVETKLATVLQPQIQAHPGHSGVVMLSDGRDAFAARVLLADAAERTLDLQYYIWHADLSGTLLFGAVHRAADRGVRVRLLLDDNATAGLDATLAALDAHPNIEVRLFNAFVHRRVRVLGYLTDFSRLNRRMHNKSFTVDNEVTIVGGRNVGDEYFGADQELSFVDLDVLAVGPVVQDVSADFDRYWECASSCPVARVIRVPKPESLAALSALCARAEHDPDAQAYV
ncbi:MAG: phospholipase D-like domain-containing protein, partial [Gemmatimonadaceae bacterium]